MAKRVSDQAYLDAFLIKSLAVHGYRYDYSNVTVQNIRQSHLMIGCREHGVFKMVRGNHMQGQGCPVCGRLKATQHAANTRRVSWDDLIRKAKEVHGGKYRYKKPENGYVNFSSKLRILCPEHGEFKQTASNHISNKRGCPECARIRVRTALMDSKELFIDKARKIHGDRYDYSKVDYNNSLSLVTITCAVHGDFVMRPNSHISSGQGCPTCSYSSKDPNKPTQIILDILADLGVDVILNDRKTLNGQEIDILCKDQSLGIEINGIHWHTEAGGKSRSYHIRKTLLAKKVGIRLLHFWDYEVLYKTDLVASFLSNVLGKTRTRIGARKLTVAQIQPDEAQAFLEENHLQGYRASRLWLGLRKADGELISLLGASALPGKAGSVELTRFCTRQYVVVPGALSRLVSKLLEFFPDAVSLGTYADLRYSTGNAYRQTGFKFSHRSEPNYVWYKPHCPLLTRYQTQKHKLHRLLGKDFKEALSEKQNMEAAGYSRIFDCGNLVFFKKLR